MTIEGVIASCLHHVILLKQFSRSVSVLPSHCGQEVRYADTLNIGY